MSLVVVHKTELVVVLVVHTIAVVVDRKIAEAVVYKTVEVVLHMIVEAVDHKLVLVEAVVDHNFALVVHNWIADSSEHRNCIHCPIRRPVCRLFH